MSEGGGGKDLVLAVTSVAGHRNYVVEVKHWRSGKKVGPNIVTDFFRVVVRERRHAGLLLATYGYSTPALEVLTTLEQQRIALGSEDVIVSLCRRYVKHAEGMQVPVDQLPQLLFPSRGDA